MSSSPKLKGNKKTGSLSKLPRIKSLGGGSSNVKSSSATQPGAASVKGEAIPQPESLGDGGSTLSRVRKATLTSYSSRDLLGALGSMPISSIPEDGKTLIRQGLLEKKGVINTKWKKRIFVLTSETLLYFDREPGEGVIPKGEIDLEIIFRVDASTSDPLKFTISTPSRVYRLRARSEGEREAWLAAIAGAVENGKQHQVVPMRRGSDVLMEERKKRAMYQPAKLEQWQRWTNYDVVAWLTTIGFGDYGQAFCEGKITGDVLETLSTADLERLGISSKEGQLRFLKSVKALTQKGRGSISLRSSELPGYEN